MSERRAGRGGAARTDGQILASPDMVLLLAVQRGLLTRAGSSPGTPWTFRDSTVRSDLRRLAREDLIHVGFAGTTPPTLLPRGVRLLEVARGEYTLPADEGTDGCADS